MALIHHAQQIPAGGRYLETGSYLGCSATIVALHSTATIWAHDVWVTDWSELKGGPPPKVTDYFYEFYKGVNANSLVNRVIPIRGDSVYTVGIHADETINLAFIDGDHSYDGCLGDLKAVWSKMKVGSTVLVHDCVPDSEPLRAVKDFGKEFTVLSGTCGMVRICK